MKIGPQPDKWLRKKTKQGMRGYPVGTIAFYGPDNRRASKVAVSVIPYEGPSCTAGFRKLATCGRTKPFLSRSPRICASIRHGR